MTIERRTGLQSHSNIAIIHYLLLGAKVSKKALPSGCVWMLYEQICQLSQSLIHIPFCLFEPTILANIMMFFQMCQQKQFKFYCIMIQKAVSCFHTKPLPWRQNLYERTRQALIPQYLIACLICYLPSGEKKYPNKMCMEYYSGYS